MRRQMSKDAQRTQVADALNAIIARQGLDGVTMRTVAAEAGCSVGAVQKYFRTKDDMLVFAMQRAAERFEEQTGPIPEVALNHHDFLSAITSGIVRTLPIDDVSRAEAQVWFEFTSLAPFNARMSNILLNIDNVLTESLEAELRERQRARLLGQQVDVESVTATILALSDGVALRMLYDLKFNQQKARTVIERAVGQLLSTAEKSEQTP